MIRLDTFGTVDLRSSDGRSFDGVLAQPRRVALLVYLAAARPSGFRRRDRLTALFWPELDAAAARDALSGALRFLRQSLGADAFTQRGSEEIGINAAHLTCDAVAFRASIEASQPAEALQLYAGDFLDGFFATDAPAFEEWVESERVTLRSLAAQAARAVAEAHSTRGAHTDAVLWARRAVELAPSDERAFRRLLGFLHRAGDRAGALDAYQAFVRTLRAEYDAEPAPETQRLIATIQRARETSVESTSAVTAPLATIPASTLSSYVVQSVIAQTSSSTAFLAKDVRHGRDVVVTVFNADVTSTIGTETLLAQIRVSASLQHPHIVPIFDSGETEGRVFYVVPRVEGESLQLFLRRKPILRRRSVLRIARDVADAIAGAHAQGAVHLDISAEAVRVSGDAASDDLHAITTYLAPEQLDGRRTDPRADVYAWGMLIRQLFDTLESSHGSTVDVPTSFLELVRQCLATDPADRPMDGRELLSRIDHVLSISRRVQPPRGRSARLTNLPHRLGRAMQSMLAAVLLIALRHGSSSGERGQFVSVAVAATDLVEGVVLDTAAVILSARPRTAVPFGAFTSVDGVVGRVTRAAIAHGDVFVPNRLAQPGKLRKPVLLANGRRTFQLVVDKPASSTGRLPAGSRVDVVIVERGSGRRDSRVLLHDVVLRSRITGVTFGSVGDSGTPTAMATLELTSFQVEQLREAARRFDFEVVLHDSTHSSADDVRKAEMPPTTPPGRP